MTTHKPSKTVRKREVLALQALGEQLIDLTEEQLRDMGLPDKLRDAVTAATTIKSHGAMRRQRQLIGKLMRDIDPLPIRRAIEEIRRQQETEKEIFRHAERWRDRIVQREFDGLNEFFELTGHANNVLSAMLARYLALSDDVARRALRRKIFRQVHEELTRATIAR